MCTALREFEQESINKGRQEGFELGRKNMIQLASAAQEKEIKINYRKLEEDPAYQEEVCKLLGITLDE